MKLCAIYNVWGDYDLLVCSIKNIFSLVDGIIVVYSTRSNYGEVLDEPLPVFSETCRDNILFVLREPQFSHPMNSETDKRNFGLNKAREFGYTHFLMMDADEYYNPVEFLKAKERFHVEPELEGLV